MKQVKPDNPLESKDFEWLLNTLSTKPSLPLNIPETLIFSNFHPSSFTYSTPKRLRFTTNIKPNEIISLCIRRVRQRKLAQKSSPLHFFKEVALLRYKNQTFKTIGNELLVSLLLDTAYNSEWTDLLTIQALTSNFSPQDSLIKVNYNSKSFNLAESNPMINEIIQNLATKNLILIKARFEFMIDSENQIWLSYASEIQVQKLKVEVNSADIVPLRMSEDIKKMFLESLDYHTSHPKSKRLLSIQNRMTEQYRKMKDRLKIDETLNTVFHFDVPEMTLPFLPESRHKVPEDSSMFMTDPRNTSRTIRRLSLFQSNEFKFMRSSRKRGRSIFE